MKALKSSDLRTFAGLEPDAIRQKTLDAALRRCGADLALYYQLTRSGHEMVVSNAQLAGGEAPELLRRLHAHSFVLHQIYDPTRPRPRCRRRFIDDAALWPRDLFERSPLYATLFRPHHLAYQMRLLVYDGRRYVGWLGLLRTHGRPFSRRDSERLQPYVPYLRDALIFADRKERAGVRADDSGELVLRPDGTVELACAAGWRWLALPGFADALAQAVRALDRGDAPSSAFVGATAIKLVAVDGLDRGVRYVARLAPARHIGLAPDADLTPAQRRVAHLAAAGATVKEIAAALDARPETIRSHLRQTYRRLAIGSRTELTALLLHHQHR